MEGCPLWLEYKIDMPLEFSAGHDSISIIVESFLGQSYGIPVFTTEALSVANHYLNTITSMFEVGSAQDCHFVNAHFYAVSPYYTGSMSFDIEIQVGGNPVNIASCVLSRTGTTTTHTEGFVIESVIDPVNPATYLLIGGDHIRRFETVFTAVSNLRKMLLDADRLNADLSFIGPIELGSARGRTCYFISADRFTLPIPNTNVILDFVDFARTSGFTVRVDLLSGQIYFTGGPRNIASILPLRELGSLIPYFADRENILCDPSTQEPIVEFVIEGGYGRDVY
nr:hypothetical protein [Candidatus Sigynarchaeota archaeon]